MSPTNIYLSKVAIETLDKPKRVKYINSKS